jgi:hypothetical protein
MSAYDAAGAVNIVAMANRKGQAKFRDACDMEFLLLLPQSFRTHQRQ